MKLFLLILGIVVILLNIFLWYSKKKIRAANGHPSSDSDNYSQAAPTEFLDSPEADDLKKAAAAELGIAVEQLNRMSTEEIAHMASEKGLI
ncbi:MAG: hypothetical protein QNJ26_01520 [Desulfobacterales bacterium]|nr:hypothetical protein [Desulfobacterales bacterium]